MTLTYPQACSPLTLPKNCIVAAKSRELIIPEFVPTTAGNKLLDIRKIQTHKTKIVIIE